MSNQQRVRKQFDDCDTCEIDGLDSTSSISAGVVVDYGNEDNSSENDSGYGDKIWTVMACGAGLFSDGYINNVQKKKYFLLFRPPFSTCLLWLSCSLFRNQMKI